MFRGGIQSGKDDLRVFRFLILRSTDSRYRETDRFIFIRRSREMSQFLPRARDSCIDLMQMSTQTIRGRRLKDISEENQTLH